MGNHPSVHCQFWGSSDQASPTLPPDAPSAFCGSSLGRACRIDKGAMTPKRLHTPCARCRHHKIRPLSWAPVPCPRHVSRPFAQQSHQAPGASSAASGLNTAFALAFIKLCSECSSRQTRTVGRARVTELARLPPPLYRKGQVPSGPPGMPWVPSLSEMEHPGIYPFPRVSHSCNNRIDVPRRKPLPKRLLVSINDRIGSGITPTVLCPTVDAMRARCHP